MSLLLLFGNGAPAAPEEPPVGNVSGAVHYPYQPRMIGGRELLDYEEWRSRLDDDDLAIISTLLL